MLGDISRVQKIYLVTGRIDMRKGVNGLMAIIRDTYQMDPYANARYLFCGKKEIGSKHSTLIKQVLFFYIRFLTRAVFSGFAMLRKSER